ncbi:MAG: hypothetical protein AAB391_00840 [Patescibacteria group bacterium]
MYVKVAGAAFTDPSVFGGDGSVGNPYGAPMGSIDYVMSNILGVNSANYALKDKPSDTKLVIHLKNGTYLTAGFSTNNTCGTSNGCLPQWTLPSNASIVGESRDGTIIKLDDARFTASSKMRLADISVIVGDGYKWVGGVRAVPSAEGIKNLTIDANYSTLVEKFNSAPFNKAVPENRTRIHGVQLFGEGNFADGIRLKNIGNYYGTGGTESFGILLLLSEHGVADPNVRYNASCTGDTTDVHCSRIVNSVYEESNLHSSLRNRQGLSTVFNITGSWNSNGTNDDPAHTSRKDVFMNRSVIANNTIRFTGVNGEDSAFQGYSVHHTYGGKVFNNIGENIAAGYYSDWWQDYNLEIYNNHFLGVSRGIDIFVDRLPNFKKIGYNIHNNEITLVPVNEGARAGIRIIRNLFNPSDSLYYPPSTYARELKNFRVANNDIRFISSPIGEFQNSALLITEVEGLEISDNIFDSRFNQSTNLLQESYRYFSMRKVILTSGAEYKNSGVSVTGNMDTLGKSVDCLLNTADVFLSATTTHQNKCSGAPIRTLVTPNVTPVLLPAGTINANLSITTNDVATCRYAAGVDTTYSAMNNNFTAWDTGMTHSATITGLVDGTSRSYSIRCRDTNGNVNLSDLTVTFTVSMPSTFNVSKTDSYNVSVVKGESVNTQIFITNNSGAPSVPVTFTAAPGMQLPVGISYSFSPTSCTPNPTCNVSLVITATPSAPTVTGVGTPLAFALYDNGRALGAIQVLLTVNPPAPVIPPPNPTPNPNTPPNPNVDANTPTFANPTSLSGWAWSSTIGWLSFSSTNEAAPSGDYGVNRDIYGNLTGYVWASNVGWIKFGGLNTASMPNSTVAPGTTQTNAKVDPLSGRMTGWARVCSGAQNPSTCSDTGGATYTASNPDPKGGFSGWISLGGITAAGPYGAQIITELDGSRHYTGYAWGSTVLGWIHFGILVPSDPTPQPNIVATCVAPTSPMVGAIATWRTTNVAGGNGAYTYTWSGSDVEGPKGNASTASNKYTTPGIKYGDVSVSSGGRTLVVICPEISVAPEPDPLPPDLAVAVTASPATAYVNEAISWASVVDGCSDARYTPCTYAWSGDGSISGSDTNTSTSYPTAGTKTGTLTVTSGSRTASASATVTILPIGGSGGANNIVIGGGASCIGVCETSSILGLTCAAPTRAGSDWTWTATLDGTFKGNQPYKFNWIRSTGTDSELHSPISQTTNSYTWTGTPPTQAAQPGQFVTVSVSDASLAVNSSQLISCPAVPQENTDSNVNFGAAPIATNNSAAPSDASAYKSSVTTQKGRAVAMRYGISGGNTDDVYFITQSGPAGSGVSGNALSQQTYSSIVPPTILIRGPLNTEGVYKYTLKIFTKGVNVLTGSPKSVSEITVTVRTNPDLNEF